MGESMAEDAIAMGIDPCVDPSGEEWEGGENPIYTDKSWYDEDYIKPDFISYKQAKTHAIKNPGVTFKRNPNGPGYVIFKPKNEKKSNFLLSECIESDKLNLKGKSITEFPLEIIELSGINEIDLSWNKLTEIPCETGSLSEIHALYLNHNNILSIPPEIGDLVNLRELDIGCNKFHELPKEIGNLINIEKLDVSDTMLTKLPNEILNLVSLKSLNLWCSHLVLNEEQKEWVNRLKYSGCNVEIYSHRGINFSSYGISNRSHILKSEAISTDPHKIIGKNDRIAAWEDIDTGLMWEVMPSCLRTDRSAADDVYKELNYLNHGGFNDWRLPIFSELQSLKTEKPTVIDDKKYYIKAPLSLSVGYGNYWADNRYRSYRDDRYAFDFVKNKIGLNRYYSDNDNGIVRASVFCVRGSFNYKGELWAANLLKWMDRHNIKHYEDNKDIESSLKSLKEFPPSPNCRNIESLPAEIGNLSNLSSIYMSYNSLWELPSEIGSLSKLSSITMHNNHISKLPPEIGELSKLRKIDFSSNNLKEIPNEIGKLRYLKEIDLKTNRLKSLPADITNLTRLTKLDLRGNQLILTQKQVEWLDKLKAKKTKCNVEIDRSTIENTRRSLDGLMGEVEETEDREILVEFPARVIPLEPEAKEQRLAWLDIKRGLMWEVKNIENIDEKIRWSKDYGDPFYTYESRYSDIFEYVEHLNSIEYAGYMDWRIPTLEELCTLNKGTYYDPPNPLSSNMTGACWSIDESDEDADYAYYWYRFSSENFPGGNSDALTYIKSLPLPVRCVRTVTKRNKAIDD